MCGIVGMVAKTNRGFHNTHAEIFSNMLIADSIRGDDSTGCFYVSERNQIEVVKQAAEPGMFLRTRSWKQFRQDVIMRGRLVVGHNRKATMGNVISKNAHPFIKNGKVLVHNGYIGNSRELDASVDVDSESILTALDKNANPIEGLKQLNGAWALAWYDQKTKHLYLTHNGERPLAICHTDDVLYFASESKMIDWLLSRDKLKHQDPIELKQHLLYEITWKGFTMETKEVPFRESQKSSVWPHRRDQVVHIHDIDRFLAQNDGSVDETAFRSNVADSEFELEERHPLDRSGPQSDGSFTFGNPNGLSGSELMKRMYSIYPNNSTVLFVPTQHRIENGDVTVHGKIWIPGKEEFNAQGLLHTPKNDGLFNNWHPKRAPLLAEIALVHRRGESVRFGLDNIRQAGSILKDSVGQEMSEWEWIHICDRFGCDKCAQAPATTQPEFTTIGRVMGKYSVLCANCLFDGGKKEKKSNLPVVVEKPTHDNGKPIINP